MRERYFLITAITPSIFNGFGYIQLISHYADGVFREINIQTRPERRVCYVASLGRDFSNIKNTMVKDFKVKYRVYYEKPKLCFSHRQKMCPLSRYPFRAGRSSFCGRTKLEPFEKELMCFKSRAKVGNVCDHDKGAPVVCGYGYADRVVVGIVVLGAKKQFCSDLLPLPFWVLQISEFKEWLSPFNDTEETSARSLDLKPKVFQAAVSSAVSPVNSSVIPLLAWYCMWPRS